MIRPRLLAVTGLLLGITSAVAHSGSPSLELRWQKDFPKPIAWYVRTSPGILLVRVGRSLTAIDGIDGRQLWELPDIGTEALTASDTVLFRDRAKTLFEIPGTGVVLLSHAKFPGASDWRTIGIDLRTGKKLWELPEPHTVIATYPLPNTHDAVLVSARLQKKVLTEGIAAEVLSPDSGNPAIYPVRFEFRRIDVVGGMPYWSSEYPHTVPRLIPVVSIAQNHLVLWLGAIRLASLDLGTGSLAWEEGFKLVGWQEAKTPLPFESADGRILIGMKSIRAIDPITGKTAWGIQGLGSIKGIRRCGDVIVAIGDENFAAVDAGSGAERWRRRTHGHATNILWNQTSDTILYADGKGLHGVERMGGKPILDASLHSDTHPQTLTFAGPGVLLAISAKQISAYDSRSGEKLFDAGMPSGYFSSIATPDAWPMPAVGESLSPWSFMPAEEPSWSAVVAGSLLIPEWQSRIEAASGGPGISTDAYETESETGSHKIWWIDSATGRKVEFAVAGTQHDVSRSMGMIFAVDGKRIWGAAIPAN